MSKGQELSRSIDQLSRSYRDCDKKKLKSSIDSRLIEVSIEVMGIQISRSDFRPKLLYLCRVSFLTTLDIYKACFRGRHIREYKENICKR